MAGVAAAIFGVAADAAEIQQRRLESRVVVAEIARWPVWRILGEQRPRAKIQAYRPLQARDFWAFPRWLECDIWRLAFLG